MALLKGMVAPAPASPTGAAHLQGKTQNLDSPDERVDVEQNARYPVKARTQKAPPAPTGLPLSTDNRRSRLKRHGAQRASKTVSPARSPDVALAAR